ncbi:MAG: helix-hairpin-helix domain-containing protein [Candidatus Omnitrophota bacterium]
MFTNSENGSILIVAIWVLLLFSLMSVGLYKIVSGRITFVSRLRGRAVSAYLGRAAYAYSRLEWDREDLEYDSLSDLERKRNKRLGNGEFEYILKDEQAKININTASSEVLSRLPGLDEEKAAAIIASPLRPFKVKEEVVAVEGIDEDSFARFGDFVTTYGNGRVNINTAKDEVLKALGMDDDLVEIINGYRFGPDGEAATEDDMFFEAADKIGSSLRGYTSLFVSQELLFIQLVSQKLLDVSTQSVSLEITTKVLGRQAMRYSLIVEEDEDGGWGLRQWRE